MYLGSWKIDDLVTFTVNTHNPTTGAGADADSDPAYRVYEDETSMPILTGVMTKLDDANTIGYYSEQITLSAANGFEKGKSYNIYIAAAVGAVTGTMNQRLQIEAEVDANIVSDKTGYALTSAYDSAKTASQDSDVDVVLLQTNKLTFDSDNYIIADARKISTSATAADNVEANISNLNATISSRLALASYNAPTFDSDNFVLSHPNQILAGTANKIADHVLRRTYANVRASSNGDAVSFRSLLGAIAKLVNKWSISGTTLTITHEDDATSAGTQTLTGTAGADPITTIDTD